MSFYLQDFELDGFFQDVISSKSTDFLSKFYKALSIILKNKNIKKEKREVFENIITQRISETLVKLVISNFTQPNIVIDAKAKIFIKAITQTKFEFFETHAVVFKKTIYDLIANSQEKSYLNKYVFKIIEKFLIKLNNIEKVKLFLKFKILGFFSKNKQNSPKHCRHIFTIQKS